MDAVALKFSALSREESWTSLPPKTRGAIRAKVSEMDAAAAMILFSDDLQETIGSLLSLQAFQDKPTSSKETFHGFPIDLLKHPVDEFCISDRAHQYTEATLSNYFGVPEKRTLQTELLVDTGCTVELYLPARQAFRLGLQKEGTERIGGFVGQKQFCHRFRPIKVEMEMQDPITREFSGKRSAFLEPYASQVEFDEMADPLILNFAGFDHGRLPKAVEGVVKLSSLKRPSDPTSAAFGILGKPGLSRLHLEVDPEHELLFALEVHEFIVTTGQS